jgi:ribosomal protein S18 acetylase RimI-like enzyme
MDLRFRSFAPADQAAVRTLVLNGLGDHFGTIDETLNPDLDDIAGHYLAAGHRVLVAEKDGAIVGSGILIEEDAATGRLVRMSVDKRQRGQGIGKQLVQHLIASARARGYTRLLIETNDDWWDAIGLYRACGFTEFDRRDGEIHMSLDLD